MASAMRLRVTRNIASHLLSNAASAATCAIHKFAGAAPCAPFYRQSDCPKQVFCERWPTTRLRPHPQRTDGVQVTTDALGLSAGVA